MRKARLALCIPFAAGGLVFGYLALSAQSTVAETAPVDLKPAVITVHHDAEAMRPVIVTETKIVDEGVQIVPQAESLASRFERLNSQLLKLDGRLIHTSPVELVQHDVSNIARDEAAVNVATTPLLNAFTLQGSRARAGATAGKRHRYAAAAMLHDLNRAIARAIRLMKKALGIK